MKKKKGLIILVIVIVLLVAAWYFLLYMGHTKVVIDSNYPVSNITYMYEDGKTKTVDNSRFNHSAYAYGLYTYTFDVEVDGKTFTPQIDVLKENAQAHYKIDISVDITSNAGKYDAVVTLDVNGSEKTQTFEDIENNKIDIRF